MMPISRQPGISYFSSNSSCRRIIFSGWGQEPPGPLAVALVHSLKEELSPHQTQARTDCQGNKHIYHVEYSDISPRELFPRSDA